MKKNTLISAALVAQFLAGATPHMVLAETSISLKGGVEKFDTAGFASQISHLTDAALQRDPKYTEADALVKKYSTAVHKTKVIAKEFLNQMVPYRGFAPSKEGSQVVLEDIKKIKSLQAAEMIKQRVADETHAKTVGSVLQIAMGLDVKDKQKSDEMVRSGMDDLKELVGEDEASRMLHTMQAWQQDLSVADSVYSRDPWDVKTVQKNIHNTTAYAFLGDPVITEVVNKVKKFNKGKAMMALSSLIEGGTAMATLLSPGLAFPILAEMTNAGFVTGTGGAEETKLVQQMYYAKRIESRWKRTNEEAQLAVTNYDRAVQTKSPTLLACSESVLQNLIGAKNTAKVVGNDLVCAAIEPRESETTISQASSESEGTDAADAAKTGAARKGSHLAKDSGATKIAEDPFVAQYNEALANANAQPAKPESSRALRRRHTASR